MIPQFPHILREKAWRIPRLDGAVRRSGNRGEWILGPLYFYGMRFPEPLIPAVLLRRYKRFLADVRLGDGPVGDGAEITVHCPNPGAMTGCSGAGWPALISLSRRPGRKLAHTLELVHNGACWIGVNPGLANAVVEEALRNGGIPGLEAYRGIRREAAYGTGSRVDFLLSGPGGLCYLEVKSVTMLGREGHYAFPDAVTACGLKHIKELEVVAGAGHRAVLLFLIQRSDGLAEFRAAAEVDPAYALGLEAGSRAGVEVLAFLTEVGPDGITMKGPIPYREGESEGPSRPKT